MSVAQPHAPSDAASASGPAALPAWAELQRLASTSTATLRTRFATDPARAERMQASAAGIRLDYARQDLDDAVLGALFALAREAGLEARRDAMFAGEPINATERRPVLHVALRGGGAAHAPWGGQIAAEVEAELERMLSFADRLRAGELRGHSGRPITDVLHLGIGGSDLGPRMALEALAPLAGERVRVHFVSNPDPWALHAVLRTLDAASTLIIVSSKTFTTQETLTNAASARRWLADAGCPPAQEGLHLAAVTASPAQTARQGYPLERTFRFWDWVGGRYSLWSTLGLPLAIGIGATAFRELLAGGREMDAHFLDAPLEQNLPVLLALTGIWNRNFLQCPTQLLVPYASRLGRFTAFVQQMDMESNGKSTHVDGSPATIGTGPIVWGGLGIDGQHAYFQLLHQGRHRVPVEFVGVLAEDTPLPLAAEHARVVRANMVAQARALAVGRDLDETRAALRAAGLAPDEVERLSPHRCFRGDVPSHLLWLDRLDARQLGALVALYEHKVFVQAAVWGIHAYDQWGVELGKQIVHELHPVLEGAPIPAGLDSATVATLRLLGARD